MTNHSGAPFRCDNPGPVGPRRIVANVLIVTALKLRYPMLLLVLVEANDRSVHGVQGA